jgi:hypothetical protein
MLWTSVPEAAVHEHGETRCTEDDVDAALDVWFWPRVLSKA